MKKILLIHHHGSIGGAGVSFLHIVRNIDKDKYKVIVLCPGFPDNMINLLKQEQCEVIDSGSSPKIFAHYNGGIKHAVSYNTLRNLIDIIKDRKKIAIFLKQINPDIVAVNSMTLFWIGEIAKKFNIKTICFHRETYQRGLFGFRSYIIKRGLSKWFDKVAFISKFDLEQTGKINSVKELIYDRVDTKMFNKLTTKGYARSYLQLNTKKKYILYLGGLSSLKGAHIMMNAMRFIKDKQINLLFVEDISLIELPSLRTSKGIKEKLKFVFNKGVRNKTLNVYFKHNLKDRVIFLKKTNNPEMYYKAADAVVFPSTLAHQSRPIYEAGISNIPIIIADFIETQEFTKDEKTICFSKSDARDLAKKIDDVFTNVYDLKKITEKNLSQIKLNHDLGTLSVDLNRLLDFN